MRRGNIFIVLAVVSVAIVASIVAAIVSSAQSSPSAALTRSNWTLITMVVDGQEQALSPTHPATLHFDTSGGLVSGSGGCNTFSGSYTLNDGNQLQFGALRSTLIACLDPVVSGQESQYLQALPRVQTYQVAGTTLTLRGDSDRVQLIFRTS